MPYVSLPVEGLGERHSITPRFRYVGEAVTVADDARQGFVVKLVSKCIAAYDHDLGFARVQSESVSTDPICDRLGISGNAIDSKMDVR